MLDLPSVRPERKSGSALRGPKIAEKNGWDDPEQTRFVTFRNGFRMERFLVPRGVEKTRSRVTMFAAARFRLMYLHRHDLGNARKQGDVVLLAPMPARLEPRRNLSRWCAELSEPLEGRRSDWMAASIRLQLTLINWADHATGFVWDQRKTGRKRTMFLRELAARAGVSERCASDHFATERHARWLFEKAIRKQEEGEIRTTIPHLRCVLWKNVLADLSHAEMTEAIANAKRQKDAADARHAEEATAARLADMHERLAKLARGPKALRLGAAAQTALQASIEAWEQLSPEERDALEAEVVARDPDLARGKHGLANVREAARKLFEERGGNAPPGASGAAGNETPSGAA